MKPGDPIEDLQPHLRATKIIFAAIAGGIALMIGVSLVVNQLNGPFAEELAPHTNIIIGVLAVISFAAIIIGKTVYSKDIRYAKENLISDTDKLMRHRSALIKYMAACEFPAILGIILFFLIGSFVFVVFSAVLLGFILVMAPNGKKLAEELSLDWTHRDSFK